MNMKRNNVEEALYEKKKKEKRKINWAETFEEFDDEYPGWSFTSLMILGILCFIGLIYLVYYSIDVVMLTNIVGSYATGVYNASYKLISVLTLFYSVYTAVIFPIMSKFFENDEKLLIISFERSIKYLMMIMIPIAIVTTFYSSDIILLIYGSEIPLPDVENFVLEKFPDLENLACLGHFHVCNAAYRRCSSLEEMSK